MNSGLWGLRPLRHGLSHFRDLVTLDDDFGAGGKGRPQRLPALVELVFNGGPEL